MLNLELWNMGKREKKLAYEHVIFFLSSVCAPDQHPENWKSVPYQNSFLKKTAITIAVLTPKIISCELNRVIPWYI